MVRAADPHRAWAGSAKPGFARHRTGFAGACVRWMAHDTYPDTDRA